MNETYATETERLHSVADLIAAETKRAYKEVCNHYGVPYAAAWRAGRQQAVEEIRAL